MEEKIPNKNRKKRFIISIIILIILLITISITLIFIISSKNKKSVNNEAYVDNSNATTEEIYNMLVEDGFKFTVGSNEYYYNVWAYGSGKNENISLNYSYNYSHREFTGLSFSDSSLDQNTPTSYHLVGNFPHDSSAQKHAAEKWLNSYGISVNQLEEVLQYAYKVNLNSN